MPYHWQIASNRYLTITPHIYTGVLPAVEAKYRDLNSLGAYQIGGFLTYGTIDAVNSDATSTRKGVRAYFEANGRFQLDPLWSITTSFRVATDKTITRRYDITNDDRLRNVAALFKKTVKRIDESERSAEIAKTNGHPRR